MKTMKYFLSMAALALVGAMTVSCSSDDNIIEQPQQPETKNNVVTLTTTVGFDNAAGTTRALSSTGVKTFAAGETMALVYKNTGGSTVKVVSAALTDGNITDGGKSATFTFELTDPDKAQDVTYIYPAAMAKDDGTVNYSALNSQNGTLTTLSSNLDFCTKSGAWDGGNLPSLTLENQLAILALTLKNSTGSSDITSTITGVTITDGTNTYNVTREAVAGPIYVAIRPTSSATIDVTATDGTNEYRKTLSGKTYTASNGYPVSWKMAKCVIWNSTDISSIDLHGGSKKIGDITFACDGSVNFSDSYLDSEGGDISFTSSLGNIKKIEINHSDYGYWSGAEGFPGWPSGYIEASGTFTWEGETPVATVKLPENEGYGCISGITSIVFTLE